MYKQDEAVVKVDSTKEAMKMPRWVSAEASEKYTAARAGMIGKEKQKTCITRYKKISAALQRVIISSATLRNPWCWICALVRLFI